VNSSFKIAGLKVEVAYKDIKNVHLSVKPPDGRVLIVAPHGTRPESVRAYAASKLPWIHAKRIKLAVQRREIPRQYVSRESHMLWGKRFMLRVVESDSRREVTRDHRTIVMTVPSGSNRERRHQLMSAWHRQLLHEAIPPLIAKWEKRLGVEVHGYALQQMKTKWGSCNRKDSRIRINTELVKKPKELLHYVVIHEMLHLLAPTHSEKFVELLTAHYPSWREARAELNALPITSLD